MSVLAASAVVVASVAALVAPPGGSPALYYLGIDAGTQSTKAVVYNADTRQVVGRGAASYGLIESDVVGRAEQLPSAWVDAMWSACREALAQAASQCAGGMPKLARSVQGIGVSGQQHGLVALDGSFGIIRPAKLWCDTESAPEAAELSHHLEVPIVASFTASKLLWLKRQEPESWAKLEHVALPHDYLNYVLTGELVMEGSDASGTGLLDPTTRTWDASAAALVDEGLLQKLPPLVAPGELAGRLQPSAAKELALPAGIPVSAGGGDNPMSALGCGCATIGRVAVSLGTSGTVFGKAPAAARDPSGTVCGFLDATGGGLPLICTLNCAQVPEEVRAAYGLSRDEIAALALAEPAGCDGLSLLPFFAGERTPNWPHASGTLAGLRAGHLARPGLLYRAAVEGATFALRAGYEAMHTHGLPEALDEVRLVGGGSKSALWRQTVADAFNARVACPTEPESAALGAALQAAAVDAGAGADIGGWIAAQHDPPVSVVVDPDPHRVAALEEAYAAYTARAEALFGEPRQRL